MLLLMAVELNALRGSLVLAQYWLKRKALAKPTWFTHTSHHATLFGF
jgi:hypothetical protein